MEPSYFSNTFWDSSLLYSSSSPKYSEWSGEENKLFENALAEFNLDSPDLFEKIAWRIPGKTIEQIKKHYEALVEDIEMIESGRILIPDYETTSNNEYIYKSTPTALNSKSTHHQHPKKGLFWTEEEHKNFLIGLERYGKGDWRSISRLCVRSRTPTQVASHAQKYFLNLEKYSAPDQNAKSTSNPNNAPMAMAPSPSRLSGRSAAFSADQP